MYETIFCNDNVALYNKHGQKYQNYVPIRSKQAKYVIKTKGVIYLFFINNLS